MPHQCTECGRTFPDGSKEMLSGCPDCGGNKFQFDPSGGDDADAADADASPPDRPGGVADRVGRATAAVKGWMSSSDDGDATESAGSTSAGPTPDSPSAPDAGGAADSESDPAADPSGSTGTADDPAHVGESAPDAVESGDGDRAYGEWPNPDGVDTSGVGKGPEDRATRERRADDAGESPTDGAAEDDATGDVEGPTRPDEAGIDAGEATDEDTAQATARTDVVSPDELPDDPPDSGTLGPRGGAPAGTGADGARARSHADAGPAQSDTGVDADAPSRTDDGAPPDSAGDAPATLDSTPAPEDARVASEPAEERPDLEDLREELNDQFESIRIVEPGQYELNLMELYDREEYIISLQEDGRYVIEVPERWRDDEE
jgi:predicted  nucleic acid-binding Zn-ribbon protein